MLKAIAGRPAPNYTTLRTSDADAEVESRRFRFGFLRGGVFHGWPSGHTATSVALATTLAAYDQSWWVTVPAFLYATWVSVGVTVADAGEPGASHWLSDAVAGALIAWPIGWSVGTSFRSDAQEGRPSQLRLAPFRTDTAFGLALTFTE